MGDYQVVVSTPDNVRKSIDMRLRVFADKPAVKFFDVSKNSFYPNNRFENQFKLRWHSTEVAFVHPPAPGSKHGSDFFSCRDFSLAVIFLSLQISSWAVLSDRTHLVLKQGISQMQLAVRA